MWAEVCPSIMFWKYQGQSLDAQSMKNPPEIELFSNLYKMFYRPEHIEILRTMLPYMVSSFCLQLLHQIWNIACTETDVESQDSIS